MNFDFFNKLFTAKRLLITFLLLLLIFVVSLLIYGYDSMHDPEKVKARMVEWNKKMESRIETFCNRRRKKNYERKVYWQEVKGKGVSLVIECLYFKDGASSCTSSTHEPNYGFNTSYIKISFHSELLPHWQQLNQDAVQLIESFKVAEK